MYIRRKNAGWQRGKPLSWPAILLEFMPADIEVLRDPLGKPFVCLYGKAEETAKRLGIVRLEVSISNTKEYAMAFAVGEA